MKLTLNLTYEDGAKVIEALRETAVAQGWDEDELDDSGIIEEFSEVVDAALTAMGIEVRINNIPSEVEEEEDFSFDEDDIGIEEDDDEEEDMESIIYDCDGHRGISAQDAQLLMRCVADVMHEQFGYLPDEVITILIQNETMRIASEWNIEVVDMSEDE